MNAAEMVELNNQLRKQLNEENAKYYENLLVYIRSQAFAKSEQETEDIALEILQDILEAQKHQQTAEDYFGKQPKEVADELVRQMSFSTKEVLKLIAIAFGSYAYMFIFGKLIIPNQAFDIGQLLIIGLLAIIFAIGGLVLIGKSVYWQLSKLLKIVVAIVAIVIFSAGVGTIGFVKTPWTFILPDWLNITGLIVLFVIGVFVLTRSKNQLVELVCIPFVTSYLVVSVVVRVPAWNQWLMAPENQVYTVTGLFVFFLIQVAIVFWIVKKRSPKD